MICLCDAAGHVSISFLRDDYTGKIMPVELDFMDA